MSIIAGGQEAGGDEEVVRGMVTDWESEELVSLKRWRLKPYQGKKEPSLIGLVCYLKEFQLNRSDSFFKSEWFRKM